MDNEDKRYEGVAPLPETENPTAAYTVVEDDQLPGQNLKSHNDVLESARLATAKEQKMSLWQGVKLYPKAVFWSMLISTCICMEGYDLCLLSNFYGKSSQLEYLKGVIYIHA
jgi:SP family general alpha glucoside:H+ symporter-like MFS transporter